jgi:hypothetical protein
VILVSRLGVYVCRRGANPSTAHNFSNIPLDSLYDFVIDSSESYLGWDFGDTELDPMKTLNSHAPNTPPQNWFPTDATYPMALPTETAEYERDPASSTALPSPPTTRDSQPADSPWVSNQAPISQWVTNYLTAPCLQTKRRG